MTSVGILTYSTVFNKSRTLPLSLPQGETEIRLDISQTTDYQENELYKRFTFHFTGDTGVDIAQQVSEVLLRASLSPGYSLQSATLVKSEFVGLGALNQEITVAFDVEAPSIIKATINVPLGPVIMWVRISDVA